LFANLHHQAEACVIVTRHYQHCTAHRVFFCRYYVPSIHDTGSLFLRLFVHRCRRVTPLPHSYFMPAGLLEFFAISGSSWSRTWCICSLWRMVAEWKWIPFLNLVSAINCGRVTRPRCWQNSLPLKRPRLCPEHFQLAARKQLSQRIETLLLYLFWSSAKKAEKETTH
jgi:hypothetical protein